jgi:hypothetical protein
VSRLSCRRFSPSFPYLDFCFGLLFLSRSRSPLLFSFVVAFLLFASLLLVLVCLHFLFSLVLPCPCRHPTGSLRSAIWHAGDRWPSELTREQWQCAIAVARGVGFDAGKRLASSSEYNVEACWCVARLGRRVAAASRLSSLLVSSLLFSRLLSLSGWSWTWLSSHSSESSSIETTLCVGLSSVIG